MLVGAAPDDLFALGPMAGNAFQHDACGIELHGINNTDEPRRSCCRGHADDIAHIDHRHLSHHASYANLATHVTGL